MIAKIAYSYAYAEGALNNIDGKSVVLPSILGEKDNIGIWVGTLDTPLTAKVGLLHHLKLIEDKKQGYLKAEIQLFSRLTNTKLLCNPRQVKMMPPITVCSEVAGKYNRNGII